MFGVIVFVSRISQKSPFRTWSPIAWHIHEPFAQRSTSFDALSCGVDNGKRCYTAQAVPCCSIWCSLRYDSSRDCWWPHDRATYMAQAGRRGRGKCRQGWFDFGKLGEHMRRIEWDEAEEDRCTHAQLHRNISGAWVKLTGRRGGGDGYHGPDCRYPFFTFWISNNFFGSIYTNNLKVPLLRAHQMVLNDM